jgi:hypothetical protein
MVEVYNTRANTQGLEPHEMRAVSSLAELQQQRFDLAVVRTSVPLPVAIITPHPHSPFIRNENPLIVGDDDACGRGGFFYLTL